MPQQVVWIEKVNLVFRERHVESSRKRRLAVLHNDVLPFYKQLGLSVEKVHADFTVC